MRTLRKFGLTFMVLLALSTTAFGQATTTLDRLSSALAGGLNPPNRLTVVTGTNSAAAFAVGNFVYIDKEAMQITIVPATGSTYTVVRGVQGTFAQAHAAGAAVYVGPANRFIRTPKVGTCTATAEVALPQINTADGLIYDCKSSQWTANNYSMSSSGGIVDDISNVAFTTTLDDEHVVFSVLSTGRTVTLPSITNTPGRRIIVTNNTTNGSTITIASVNSQYIGPAPNATASISLIGPGNSVSLMSTSTGWFTY
jgi:hypothetical protein